MSASGADLPLQELDHLAAAAAALVAEHDKADALVDGGRCAEFDAVAPTPGLVPAAVCALVAALHGGGGDISVARPFDYYHYTCDGIDDRNWGCAYRCLQMLIAASDVVVPRSIRDIQSSLVDIKQLQPAHVGTKKWIEPSHAAAYLRAVLRLDAAYVELYLSDDVTGATVIREIRGAIRAHGGPVMIDNGISAYIVCAASGGAVAVLDPHVCAAIAPGDVRGAMEARSCTARGADFFDAAPTRKWMLAYVRAAAAAPGATA